MTPKQLSEALLVRRRREDRALRAFKEAQGACGQAEQALRTAHGMRESFDRAHEAKLAAFQERARNGFSPEAVLGMRAFHAEQMIVREQFAQPIAMAETAVALAEQAAAAAHAEWRRVSQAAENLQELYEKSKRDALRTLERRQEQDRDEISATRSMRFGME